MVTYINETVISKNTIFKEIHFVIAHIRVDGYVEKYLNESGTNAGKTRLVWI